MKLRKIAPSPGSPDYIFFCPGCECGHGVWTTLRNDVNSVWSFNGSMERPTFSPSLLVKGHNAKTGKDYVCHSFVTDGKIQYLNDCSHELKGQTIELPEF